MVIMSVVRVMNVKKVAYELIGNFAKVGAPQAANYISNPPENFYKTFFSLKVLIEIYTIVIAIYLINPSFEYQCVRDDKTYKKHVWVILTHCAVIVGSTSPLIYCKNPHGENYYDAK